MVRTLLFSEAHNDDWHYTQNATFTGREIDRLGAESGLECMAKDFAGARQGKCRARRRKMSRGNPPPETGNRGLCFVCLFAATNGLIPQ
jgi:hypothetical protein